MGNADKEYKIQQSVILRQIAILVIKSNLIIEFKELVYGTLGLKPGALKTNFGKFVYFFVIFSTLFSGLSLTNLNK